MPATKGSPAMSDNADLVATLRKSKYLKLAQSSVFKAVAPTVAATTAAGAMTGWDPDTMAGTAMVTPAAHLGMNRLGKRFAAGATTAEATAASAAERHRQESAIVSKPHTPFTPEPVPTVAPPAPAFDAKTLTPARQQQHAAFLAAEKAQAPAFTPKPFGTPEVRAPQPIPTDPTRLAELQSHYEQARAEDVTAMQNLAAKLKMPSVDDLFARARGKGGDKYVGAIQAELDAVNARHPEAPRPPVDLRSRIAQPFSDWQGRATNASAEFPGALQSRHTSDLSKRQAWEQARDADLQAQQQAFSSDPAVVAHQAAVAKANADRLAFEQTNTPAPKTLAEHQAEINEKNRVGQLNDEGARAVQSLHTEQIPEVAAEAERTQAAAEAERRTANRVQKAAPYVAAAAGTAAGTVPGVSHVTRAAGNAALAAPRALGNRIADGSEEPATKFIKEYWPAVAGIGAVAALAYLLSRDDDDDEPSRKHAMESLGTSAKRKLSRALKAHPDLGARIASLPKVGAVADDDHVARAARNRRRIEGLLARNPKALDNIDADGALHALPIQLDAAQKAKLAAALQAN